MTDDTLLSFVDPQIHNPSAYNDDHISSRLCGGEKIQDDSLCPPPILLGDDNIGGRWIIGNGIFEIVVHIQMPLRASSSWLGYVLSPPSRASWRILNILPRNIEIVSTSVQTAFANLPAKIHHDVIIIVGDKIPIQRLGKFHCHLVRRIARTALWKDGPCGQAAGSA